MNTLFNTELKLSNIMNEMYVVCCMHIYIYCMKPQKISFLHVENKFTFKKMKNVQKKSLIFRALSGFKADFQERLKIQLDSVLAWSRVHGDHF